METTEILLIACPVCLQIFGSNSYKKKEYPANNANNDFCGKPHSIFFCDHCGVGIAFPKLTEDRLIALYSEGDFWRDEKPRALSPRRYPGHYVLAHARWDFVVPFIEKNMAGKTVSILDIGAGHGFFGMAVAENQKVYLEKYCAIEKDPALRESLKKNWDRRFPKIKFEVKESLAGVEGEYDIIVFSNILEHLNNPIDAVKAGADKLIKGGFVFIDVPNHDYLFKKDVFPHTLFFNKQSLEILFRKSGLTVNYISGYGRNIVSSPVNYRNDGKALSRAARVLYKMRFIIPLKMLKVFFTYYFGSDKENADGTWLRALGQKIY